MAKQKIEIETDIQKALSDVNKLNELLFKNTDAIKAVSIANIQLKSTSKDGQKVFADLSGELQNGEKFLQRFRIELNKVKDVLKTVPIGNLKFKGSDFVGPPLPSPAQRERAARATEERLFVGPARPTPAQFERAQKDTIARLNRESGLDKVIRDIEKADRAASRFNLTLGEISRTIEAQTIKRAFTTITNGIEEGIAAALRYQIAISEIRTISQSNQLSFGQWSESIRRVSDQLGLPIADTAEAAYQALSNQVVKSNEAFEFLLKTGEFARTTQANLTEAVNLTSSAMNVFGFTVSDLDQVQAKFFKAVELGRFRVEDQANTFGRAAVLAKDLGVTFEELEAAYAVLTVKGLTAADAGTFVTNVFQKLTKPTERLSKVFDELGVSSGKAAVETFGFANVLQKLFDLDKSGNLAVAEIFNEIRGRKGFTGITGIPDEFNKTINALTNSLGDYRNAVAIRGESPADFLIKEANKLKNIAIQDFGQQILKAAADGVKGIQTLGLAFPELSTSITGTTAKTIAFSVAIGIVGAKIPALVTAFSALAANPFALAIAGVAALGIGLNNALDKSVQLKASLQELTDEINAKTKVNGVDSIVAETDKGRKEFEKTLKSVTDLNQAALQGVAKASQTVNQSLGGTRDKIKVINEELKLSLKSYLDGVKTSINNLESAQTRARQNIKDNNKRRDEFALSRDKLIFDEQLSIANPQQKLNLRAQQIEKLKSEAAKLLRSTTGDPTQDAENANVANDKLREAQQLIRDNFNQRVEEAKAANQGRNIVISTIKLREDENALVALQGQLLQRNNDIQEENRKKLEAQEKKERERFNRIQQTGAQFQQFSLTDKEGKVKPEFADPKTGKIDPAKALTEFERIAGNLRGTIGNDAAAQINFLQLFETKKTAITLEAAQLRAKEQLEIERRRIQDSKDLIEKELQGARKGGQLGQNQIFGQGQTIDQIINKDLASLQQFLDVGVNSLPNPQASKENADRFAAGKREFALAQTDLKNLTKRLQDIQTSGGVVTKDGLRSITPADLLEIRQQVLVIKDQISAGVRNVTPNGENPLQQGLRTGGDSPFVRGLKVLTGRGNTINDAQTSATLGDVVNALEDRLQLLEKAARDIAKSSDTVEKLRAEEGRLKDGLGLAGIPAQADEAQKRVTSSFDTIRNSVNSVKDTVDQLNESLKKLDLNKLNELKGQIGQDGQVAPDQAGFFAAGGIVGFHPGGPRGTDTVPAWLTPGERILTPAQNRTYERIMRVSNSSARYFASGGAVNNNSTSTTVGDIHLHLDKNTNMSQFARSLTRHIQRRGLR